MKQLRRHGAHKLHEQLRESEERFRSLFEQTTGGIAQTDLDGRFVLVNDRYCDIVGRPRKELLQLRMQDITHPDDLHDNVNHFTALVAGGPSFVIEKRYVRPEGSHVWVRNHVAAIRDATGVVRHIAAAVMDITEHKIQENARRRLQEELELILDNAPAMIWCKDTQNRILRANREAAESIGLSKEQIEGRSVAELYPEDADRYYRDDLIVIDTRRPRLGIIEPYQLPTGEKRWVRSDKVPMKNEAGQVTGVLVLAQDITEHQRAEEALRVSDERKTALLQLGDRLRELTDTGELAFAAAEILGKTLAVSRCGYGTVDLASETITIERDWSAPGIKSLAGVLHFRDYGSYIEDLKRGETVVFADAEKDQRTIATADALKAISAQSVVNMPVSEQGGLVALLYLNHAAPREWTPDELSFIREVAERTRIAVERRSAEERLQLFAGQLEQLVAERTAELVHSQSRLRALATELNLTEQRERKRVATELHDHLAQLMVLGRLTLSQAKRLAGVPSACAELIARTEEVLTESLAYTRTLVADLAPPVLHDLGLPTALKWLGERMERHELSVTVELETDERLALPEDQSVLLFQSVRELLMNASKHAGSAEAKVTLERRNGDLHITVEDHGKGFDQAAIATGNFTSQSKALKFGLFSIRERMKALGGSFTIDSTPGKGTTATLSLPLAPSAETNVLSFEPHPEMLSTQQAGTQSFRAALNPSKPPSTHKNGTIRVLLVDDHAMVRQGLRSVLESYSDIEVVGEAWDGHEALDYVRRLQPAIVVMDVNMPKVNGVQATAIIKERHPDAIVIGLSVQTTDETRTAMMKAGATMLLSKEAAVDTLYETIQSALKGKVHEDQRGGIKKT